MNNLLNKKILMVICGGISAYKSLEIIRGLKKNNAQIKTILTKSAKEFVTPLSISSLSQEKVYEDMFSVENESDNANITVSDSLAQRSRRRTDSVENVRSIVSNGACCKRVHPPRSR